MGFQIWWIDVIKFWQEDCTTREVREFTSRARSLVQVQDSPTVPREITKKTSDLFMHASLGLGIGDIAQLVELRPEDCLPIVEFDSRRRLKPPRFVAQDFESRKKKGKRCFCFTENVYGSTRKTNFDWTCICSTQAIISPTSVWSFVINISSLPIICI